MSLIKSKFYTIVYMKDLNISNKYHLWINYSMHGLITSKMIIIILNGGVKWKIYVNNLYFKYIKFYNEFKKDR